MRSKRCASAARASERELVGRSSTRTTEGIEFKTPDGARVHAVKVSYPFFHADRIKTPTLFMVGEKDFNVPAVGSEQMCQALKSLAVETQIVIYPNSFHGITLPSYRVDRLDRSLKWHDRYLRPVAQRGRRRGSGAPDGRSVVRR